MKRAVVSTYCDWNSFGSVLQSIGLQTALETIDVHSTVVRVEAEFDRKPVRYRKNKGPVDQLMNFYIFLHRKEIQRAHKKNRQFIQEHLRVRDYPDVETLRREPPVSDAYIAGSDQIWNPALRREEFFLHFAPEGKRVVSYAASMGVTDVSEQGKDWLRQNLEKFQKLSVREADMVSVLAELTGKQVQVHIDPTFLKSADEWRKLQKTYPVRRPYILVYPIYWDSKLNAQLRQLKKETGFDIISLHSGLRNIYADRIIRDADVGEFLWLVDHAQCVVTSSFHGVAFSTIFNKKYSAVINPGAPSRIGNLLGVLGMNTPEIKDCIEKFDVDYEAVNGRIQAEKERSLHYLKGEIFSET